MRWSWIHGAATDLPWYIGSAAAGWVYVLLVVWLGRGLEDPIVAGIVPPESAGVGARVAATSFLGWAMQHYYLDAKI